jgi:UDP-GlcNAc:undecaprenyl-phosphate/decaprenyl-phosphate GlcNAc-1-phosphate transferase
MLLYYISVFVFALVFTFVLVPLNIKLSKKLNLVDVPHERGVHKEIIPSAGGLAFALPVIIIQFILAKLLPGYKSYFFQLGFGGLAITFLGFLDDKKQFTAKYKLLFQILIIVTVYYFGLKIELLTNPFGSAIHLGILSFPFTIIWFLVVINAFNLIDGMDGLAAGIAVIVLMVLFAVSIEKSNQLVILLSLTMIGSLLAFLKFNFYPAKIFMGDTGSLFIGFNIAAVAAAGTAQFKGITAITLIIPIITLVIPLLDVTASVFRRIKRKKNIFQADKEHLHHLMLDMGFSQKAVAIIGYVITLLFGLIAFGFSFSSKEILLVILIFLIILILIFIFVYLKKELSKK